MHTVSVNSVHSSHCQQICASSVHPKKPSIPITHAVADTGATSVMIMKKTPNMKNVHQATNPLTINLPDGTMVKSTHICDLEIPGLPYVLGLSYSCVTLVLRLRYACVTLALRLRYACVTLALRLGYTWVTLGLRLRI